MDTKVFYDGSYYRSDELDPDLRSPRVVVPLVISMVQPRSVVDVGCGAGNWLRVCLECGVETVFGVDGHHVQPAWLRVPQECFRPFDLTKPLRLDRKFDLAICLEVAEHLPKGCAPGLVEALVRLAPVILFSAAVPLQRGVHHVNGQWPEYWQKLFQKHKYRMLDVVRKNIWKNAEVKFWYRQNMFLYVREDFISSRPEFLEAMGYADDLILLHRSIFEEHLGLRAMVKALPVLSFGFLCRSVRSLLHRNSARPVANS